MNLIRMLPVLVFVAILGCEGIKKYVDDGYNLDKDFSIFTRFSGKHCALQSGNGEKFFLNCENLRAMTDPAGDFCQKHQGESWVAYFPDEPAAMQLCQDRSYPQRSAQDSIRMLVFGDSGAGDEASEGVRQTLVAEAMARVCPYRGDLGADVSADKRQRGCDFAVMVGDIIYPNGIKNVFDSMLASRFEEPYGSHGRLPFYIAPGNHDYHGNVTAMVEYSWFSNRWFMPGRYFPLNDLPAWLNIFAIDSVAFTGDDGVASNYDEQMQAMQASFCGRTGWRILVGHYPPQSHGGHGTHVEQAKRLDEAHKTCPFDLYLAGHDHHLEFMQTDRYNILISGGGGAVRKAVKTLPAGTVESDPALGFNEVRQSYARAAHGFSIIELTASTMDIYYFDIDRWNPERDAFLDIPSFEDFDFHCRASSDAPLSCNAPAAPAQ
jgi:hypothetical protein